MNCNGRKSLQDGVDLAIQGGLGLGKGAMVLCEMRNNIFQAVYGGLSCIVLRHRKGRSDHFVKSYSYAMLK